MVGQCFRLLFGLYDPVGRRNYALVGVGLMLLKYLVEFVAIALLADQLFSPLDFFNPTLTGRAKFTNGAPSWFGMVWLLWTLPFLWIAIAMSLRRAADAGVSPWNGILVLVPVVNLVAMIVLACLPTKEILPQEEIRHESTVAAANQRALDSISSALGGILVGALYGLVTAQLSVSVWSSYGSVLFFGTPLVTGIAAAYIYGYRQERSTSRTLGVAVSAVFLAGLALLLFAVEGVICLLMAAPIMLPLGFFGGLIGKAIADRRRRLVKGFVACLLTVPFLGGAENFLPNTTEFVVSTSVEINASPEQVWQGVVDFPEITERPEWYFRLGIASPLRARIEGRGVGAVRHCEFTTGAFVEPITVWDAPRRLAFDVTEQPDPMFELTPYRHIHPPHLDGAFRSTRGEFRLTPLANGGTRLEESTWYQLDIYPHAYWTLWTDELVHRIHGRVLRHIKRLAESTPTG